MSDSLLAPVAAAPAADAAPAAAPVDAAPAAAPAAPAAAAGYDWSADIPENLRNEKLWEPMKGKPVADVLKAYAEGQKRFGSAVNVPGENATPEELTAFHRKLGVPETADGYDVTFVAPDGKTIDKTQFTGFLDAAHKAGMTPKQTQAVLDFYKSGFEQTMAGAVEKRAEVEAQLKQEWGPEYNRNIEYAQRAVGSYEGGPEFIAALEAVGLGNHPAVIKLFAQVGADLGEDKLVKGNTPGAVADAQQKLDAIFADPKHPYWVREDPNHKAAVAEQLRLRAIVSSPVR